ncbi:OmpH family outer membrane protein [Thermosulfurimonas sp. F29]|uniref:OmpH family outer membrane protein n=1 Tax=Thermosulfurimonas sp. F29 TaxID=2867247 RepID=UPI001C830D1A|nr:OmpH family outer membrane protein [Thermosulfurimonas sp. F29]MBX6423864.1 OmpH family outer membrane protein [Thermosulfurimonas sp. F29]
MKRFLIVVLAWTVLLAGAAFAEAPRIAVLDLQKVVRSSKAGQEAMQQLQAKFKKLQAKLEAKKKEIEAFQQELQKKAPLLSEEARAEKQREYQKMVREFRAMQEDAQFEMKEAEKKALKPIFQDLEKVIRDMARKEGYDLILEKNMPGVYWASPRVDITQHVIQLYDQYRASGKGQAK